MKTAYPVFIKQDNNDYLVYVPDLELSTEGKDFYDAINMARDAIGLRCTGENEDADDIPSPSDSRTAMELAKKASEKDFDFSTGILTYVDIDTEAYRNRMRNRAVKKNCTIPYWLNEEAEKEGVNFSKVLREALVHEIEQ